MSAHVHLTLVEPVKRRTLRDWQARRKAEIDRELAMLVADLKRKTIEMRLSRTKCDRCGMWTTVTLAVVGHRWCAGCRLVGTA